MPKNRKMLALISVSGVVGGIKQLLSTEETMWWCTVSVTIASVKKEIGKSMVKVVRNGAHLREVQYVFYRTCQSGQC